MSKIHKGLIILLHLLNWPQNPNVPSTKQAPIICLSIIVYTNNSHTLQQSPTRASFLCKGGGLIFLMCLARA